MTLLAAQMAPDDPGVRGRQQIDGRSVWLTGQWDIASDPDRVRAALTGLWNYAAASMLSELLASTDRSNTVVLLHSWNKALSSSIARAAAQYGVPVIAVLHDYSICCPNGAYYDFRGNVACALQPMSLRCIAKPCDRRALAHKAYRVVRHAVQESIGRMPAGLAGVICVSEYQRAVLQPLLPADLPCHVLPNPVDAPPAGLGAHVEASRRFLFVGRLSGEKGALVLAEAARLAGVDVAFVGDGPQRTEISAVLPQANVSGWLTPAGVWRELADCRALVYPSMLRETFGLSVYEAAALGVASIVFRGTAPAAFVDNEVNGLCVEQGNVAELAAALSRLQNDPALAAALGSSARERWQQHSAGNAGYAERLENILARAVPARS